LVLVLALTGCDGDDNGNGDADRSASNTPVADGTAAPSGDQFDFAQDTGDSSGFPMPRTIRATGGLTLLGSNAVTKNESVFVMFLVRNDGPETLQNVRALISLLDKDNLRLIDYNLASGYVNIPPGQTAPMSASYPIPPDYDGMAALILADPGVAPGYSGHYEATVTAELLPDSAEVRGTALNTGSAVLIQPLAHFVLLDSANDLVAVVPANISGLDESAAWQPGATLTLTGRILAYAGDSLSQVAQTQVIVAGYELQPR
jgi:hypothetical protein